MIISPKPIYILFYSICFGLSIYILSSYAPKSVYFAARLPKIMFGKFFAT